MFSIRAALLSALLLPAIGLAKPPLTFKLAHGSAAEQRTRQELQGLAQRHNLD